MYLDIHTWPGQYKALNNHLDDDNIVIRATKAYQNQIKMNIFSLKRFIVSTHWTYKRLTSYQKLLTIRKKINIMSRQSQRVVKIH